MSERLASSVTKTQPHSLTFEVSDSFLEDTQLFKWSGPVQFRFEEREDGSYDLIFRTYDPKTALS